MPASPEHFGAIAELMPHAGAMVLLDEIIACDEQQVHCRARIQLIEDHPLTRNGRLPAAALVEYGAQAMAVHGALNGPGQAAKHQGRLVALPEFELVTNWIAVPIVIDIHATRIGGDGSGALYTFQVASSERSLASGRATGMFADWQGA